ncbi:2Fe-2S iron-sulfur cluster-binding protein [Solimonas variicoloris]|uniref:2Fe-2S iron-sulfur cluster-binding protein n=1 Tax=Solimonas variicoloris TaxID=254408 RepID=UPI00037A8D6E|nr:2Fe-2S iron-sulfur cluster-binding protein [Solimonas variicoloris]
MVAITYIEHDGTRHTVDVDPQMNLMEGATLNMVPGVVGMCGGICSCATCHCYLPAEWIERLPPPADGERQILDGLALRRSNSRLGCQIAISAAMDGLEVGLPADGNAG